MSSIKRFEAVLTVVVLGRLAWLRRVCVRTTVSKLMSFVAGLKNREAGGWAGVYRRSGRAVWSVMGWLLGFVVLKYMPSPL